MVAHHEQPTPRLRPLSFGELLDVAFKICLEHKATLLRVVLVVVVPLQALATIITLSTIGDDYTAGGGSLGTGSAAPSDGADVDTATFVAGQLGVVVLLGLTYLLTTGACFSVIAQAYLGRRTTWKEALRFAARRALPLLWLSVLYGLGLLLGLLALIVPFFYLVVAWAVAYPVLFVEDLRGRKALGRSRRLVKGTWWRVAGVLLFGTVLATMLASMVQFAIMLPVFVAVDDGTVVAVLLNSLAAMVGQLISTPLSAAIIAVLYFDLRVRKEGFDLELLAERMGGGDAPLTPAAPEAEVPVPPQFLPPRAPSFGSGP
jgi:hypothetical protein